MLSKIKTALLNELESPTVNRTIGSGWLCGVFALFLSLAGLSFVICLHYPTLLSAPELKQFITAPTARLIIQSILLLAFTLAMVSLILRQNRTLGFLSASLILTAIIIGGSTSGHTPVENRLYFGLDWLFLNLTVTGLIFLPLERLFRRVDQSVFRAEWREDIFYFAFSSLLVQSLTFLTLWPSTTLVSLINIPNFQAMIASQPLWLQFIEIMLLTDFMQYWFHRLFHEIPVLWKFHAVHHSAQSMDWLAGSRMHVLEIVLLRSITIIPMHVMGFSDTAIYAYIVLVYLYATYLHANLKFDVEWMKPILATPRFHHWHHGIEKEAINVNYSIHFPFLDRLFGTYYMPKKIWPSGYGIKNNPVPSGFTQQFLYPFKKKKS